MDICSLHEWRNVFLAVLDYRELRENICTICFGSNGIELLAGIEVIQELHFFAIKNYI